MAQQRKNSEMASQQKSQRSPKKPVEYQKVAPKLQAPPSRIRGQFNENLSDEDLQRAKKEFLSKFIIQEQKDLTDYLKNIVDMHKAIVAYKKAFAKIGKKYRLRFQYKEPNSNDVKYFIVTHDMVKAGEAVFKQSVMNVKFFIKAKTLRETGAKKKALADFKLISAEEAQVKRTNNFQRNAFIPITSPLLQWINSNDPAAVNVLRRIRTQLGKGESDTLFLQMGYGLFLTFDQVLGLMTSELQSLKGMRDAQGNLIPRAGNYYQYSQTMAAFFKNSPTPFKPKATLNAQGNDIAIVNIPNGDDENGKAATSLVDAAHMRVEIKNKFAAYVNDHKDLTRKTKLAVTSFEPQAPYFGKTMNKAFLMASVADKNWSGMNQAPPNGQVIPGFESQSVSQTLAALRDQLTNELEAVKAINASNRATSAGNKRVTKETNRFMRTPEGFTLI